MERLYGNWNDTDELPSRSYICGYCGDSISSNNGYSTYVDVSSYLYICHKRNNPRLFNYNSQQIPDSPYGSYVKHIDDNNVECLYQEARNCLSCNANTASVICSRKLLVNIAVSKGAKEGLKFIDYIEYLSDKGFISPDGKEWVDHIRKKGRICGV